MEWDKARDYLKNEISIDVEQKSVIEVAIIAIEKNIGIKQIRRNLAAYCGKCGNGNISTPYCPYCGQKVNWE